MPDEHVLELAGLLVDAGYDETAERLSYALKVGVCLLVWRIRREYPGQGDGGPGRLGDGRGEDDRLGAPG